MTPFQTRAPYRLTFEPAPTGACCVPEACDELTESDCAAASGIFMGLGTTCDPADCNGNGVPDQCDIASGTSPDSNGNGTPDECECGVLGQQRGDCNGDGSMNGLDIDRFVNALTNPAQFNIDNAPLLWQCVADINCDGSLNGLDVDPFVQCLTVGCPPCP